MNNNILRKLNSKDYILLVVLVLAGVFGWILSLHKDYVKNNVDPVIKDSLAYRLTQDEHEKLNIPTWKEYDSLRKDTSVHWLPCIYEDSTGYVVNNCAQLKKEE